jgi:hypothetical protein
VIRIGAALIALFLLVGCAAGVRTPEASTPHVGKHSCRTEAAARALVKLHHDIAVLRAAGKIHVKDRLLGGPAVNRATDRFLLDLAKAPISNLTRNRLIDFAAVAANANCAQCFQALEAERPIPSIAHDGTGADC